MPCELCSVHWSTDAYNHFFILHFMDFDTECNPKLSYDEMSRQKVCLFCILNIVITGRLQRLARTSIPTNSGLL